MPSATAQAAGTGLPASCPAADATLLELGRAHTEALSAWIKARDEMIPLSAARFEKADALGIDRCSDAFDELPEAKAHRVVWKTFNALSARLNDLGERIRAIPPANLQELGAWASAIRFDSILENSPPGSEPDFTEQCTIDLLGHIDRLAVAPASPPPAEMLSAADLEPLSMADLYKVAGILRAISDLIAFSKFEGLLEDITGALVALASDVRFVAEKRTPRDQAEANWRGWTIAAHAAFSSEPLPDIAAKAAQAASVERFAPITR